jgi:GntP family gluconate:H+ symporter
MLLTAVGVFIDIAVITVAPIALAVAKNAGYSRGSVLLAMIGGGKCGNLMSPNPNTIATAEAFKIELSSLMTANLIPAIVGFVFTVLLVSLLTKRGELVTEATDTDTHDQPPFWSAILGPIVAISLLVLRPLCGVNVDPLIALPVGGLVGCLAMGRFSKIRSYMDVGLSKMINVAVLMLGTGTLAGIIKASTFKDVLIAAVEHGGLPGDLLAPISGILMSAATASTTAGATVASQTFSVMLLEMGLTSLAAAAMIHAGATVLDHLPHGTFFHATGGAVGMNITDRLKLIPYETLIGFVLVVTSTLLHARL